ncbi:ATP-grasp domain-containing protein [Amycolatopsis carbonis]|uniref:ATP-grasp domain-containing protein n=1 Tax=Amycolatopsis carbonis TaxID=715471 RepID=A0A9Y2IAT2_9PSEU|nr:ATP-grasp domain-containing protein [Amycolatopsis sp. 2-15]WIX76985.1 ATP-grasp domain-containing protein [Amycolatopsis sp. 2-15]
MEKDQNRSSGRPRVLIVGSTPNMYAFIAILRPHAEFIAATNWRNVPMTCAKSRWCDEFWPIAVPEPTEWDVSSGVPADGATAGFVSYVLELTADLRITHIIPASDQMIFWLSGHRAAFGDAGAILCCPDFAATSLVQDKVRLNEFAEQRGVPVPRRIPVGDDDAALVAVREELGFPVVVKGLTSAGSSGVRYAEDAGQLSSAVQELRKNSPAVALHEYIPGTTEPSVTFLLDKKGVPVVETWLRKVRYADSGRSCCVISVSPPPIAPAVREMARELGMMGWCAFQFKADSRSGELVLIEGNPRSGNNFKILVEIWRSLGIDVGKLTLAAWNGLPLPRHVTPPGLVGASVLEEPTAFVVALRGRLRGSSRPDNKPPGLPRFLLATLATYLRRPVVDVVTKSLLRDPLFFAAAAKHLIRLRFPQPQFVPWGDATLPLRRAKNWDLGVGVEGGE